MLKSKKIFKKMDIVIILILVVLSFTPEIVLGMKYNKNVSSIYAEITIGGKVFKKVPLTGHKGEEKLLIETPNGSNIAIINDEAIAIFEADCPDQVCVEPGFISKPGESLVCLPHKVMIQILGDNDEDIILSY